MPLETGEIIVVDIRGEVLNTLGLKQEDVDAEDFELFIDWSGVLEPDFHWWDLIPELWYDWNFK